MGYVVANRFGKLVTKTGKYRRIIVFAIGIQNVDENVSTDNAN